MSQAQGNRNGLHGENGATFEQSFSRLQEVVQKLSAGNLTLQDALSAFEEGMSLADSCAKMLEEAELRVKQVSARAAGAGAAALSELEASVRSAAPLDSFTGSVVEVQSYERSVILEVPVPPPPTGRTTSPGYATRPSAPPSQLGSSGEQSEDKYADSLDLDPLFDEDE